MRKLGAFQPELDFGTLAELRNRIAYLYRTTPRNRLNIE
jgi:hypothetical protein